MRLDPFTRDYRAFMAEFIEAVDAEGTLFYLDTSLLMWLLRVAPMARVEFIDWCNTRPEKAVRVPVWAAHELHRHLIANTVPSSVRATIKETEAIYRKFARLASERADDSICLAKGYPNRTTYVSQVERSLSQLANFKRVIEQDEDQLRQAAEDVISVVNAHVLASDIGRIIDELSLTGDFRSAHLIPPGFYDSHKEANRQGDVIIWEEILTDLREAGLSSSHQSRSAVLISRDQKTDWVSSAPFVINLSGLAQPSNRDHELDVTLAHPLLVHELAQRAHGNRIYFATPGLVASTLDLLSRKRGRSHKVAQWMAVSHRFEVLDRLATSELTVLPLLPTYEDVDLEIQDTPASIMSKSVAQEVQQYLEADILEQSPLVSSWALELQKGDAESYRFGRILAELSSRGVTGWPEQLPALLEQLATTIHRQPLNKTVLAITTSAFFDAYGELLRRPHAELTRMVLQLETDSRFEIAFRTLHRFLAAAGAQLPYLPGATRKPVPFDLDLVAGSKASTLREIRLGGYLATTYPLSSNNRRRISVLFGRTPDEGCTGQELRMLCAREFLVPEDLLNSSADRKKITWRNDVGLVLLDMGVEGGLAAMDDEEDEE